MSRISLEKSSVQKYDILIEGYARDGEEEDYIASPTTVLIYDEGKTILTDPGASAKGLLKALEDRELSVSDVDILFLSHYHPDHFLNLKLFPNHPLYDGSVLWDGDKEYDYEGSKVIPGTKVRIIETPGHTLEHVSLLLEVEDEGTVCVAHDVFWWEDGAQDISDYDAMINYEDPFVTDMKALKKSRKKVLEVADVIIPGHGEKFDNPFKN